MNWKVWKLPFIVAVLVAAMLIGVSLAAAQTTPAKTQAEVVAAALNVREGPGINYTVKQVVKAGDKFEISGVSADKTWVQITLPTGTTGWISALPAYTRLTGSLDTVQVVQAAPSAASTTTTAPTTPGSGKLVFMTASGGDIYIVNADGTGLRLLTRGGLDPALSPNGQQVAFTRWGPTEGVYVINSDGSNERQVHPAHQPKSPVWSPDGTQLVFTMPRGGRVDEVRECKISSKDKAEDANLPSDAFNIDRKTIEKGKQYQYCYSLPAKPAWELRKLDLATGQFQDLSSDYSSFSPTWDPRSPWRIVYAGDVSLVQLDLNQNARTSLIEGNLDRSPVFSPDGTRLAVMHKQGDNQWTIDVINLDNSQRTQLAVTGSNVAPTWSPDGSQIAFLSNRSGQWEIWTMNADGSNQHSLVVPGPTTGISFQYNFVDERMVSWGK